MPTAFRLASAAMFCLMIGLVSVAWKAYAAMSIEPEPVPEPVCEPVLFDYGTLCPKIDGFDRHLRAAADEFQVDPDILAATVLRESSCNPKVIGDGGKALGLGQVHPRWWRTKLKTAKVIGTDEDLLSASQALRAMALITAHNGHRAKGDLFDTVRRYNGSGPKARTYAEGVVVRVAELKAMRGVTERLCN